MEFTTCVGGIIASNQTEKEEEEEERDETMDLEYTSCVGGILSVAHDVINQSSFAASLDGEKAAELDFTSCVGGILQNNEKEAKEHEDDDDVDMAERSDSELEFTQCVGGIVPSKAEQEEAAASVLPSPAAVEGVKLKRRLVEIAPSPAAATTEELKAEDDTSFENALHSRKELWARDPFDESGEEDQTYQEMSVAMPLNLDLTQCVGGIVSTSERPHGSALTETSPPRVLTDSNGSDNDGVDMTSCVGGIIAAPAASPLVAQPTATTDKSVDRSLDLTTSGGSSGGRRSFGTLDDIFSPLDSPALSSPAVSASPVSKQGDNTLQLTQCVGGIIVDQVPADPTVTSVSITNVTMQTSSASMSNSDESSITSTAEGREDQTNFTVSVFLRHDLSMIAEDTEYTSTVAALKARAAPASPRDATPRAVPSVTSSPAVLTNAAPASTLATPQPATAVTRLPTPRTAGSPFTLGDSGSPVSPYTRHSRSIRDGLLALRASLAATATFSSLTQPSPAKAPEGDVPAVLASSEVEVASGTPDRFITLLPASPAILSKGDTSAREETDRFDDLVSQLEAQGEHFLGLEPEPMEVDTSVDHSQGRQSQSEGDALTPSKPAEAAPFTSPAPWSQASIPSTPVASDAFGGAALNTTMTTELKEKILALPSSTPSLHRMATPLAAREEADVRRQRAVPATPSSISRKKSAYKQRLSLAAHRASQAHVLAPADDLMEADDGENVPETNGPTFKSFVTSAGLRFFDTLTSGRRETLMPVAFASGISADESLETLEGVIKAACVLVPELEIFRSAVAELTDSTADARDSTKELEQTLNRQAPKVFTDLLNAGEVERPRLQKHLKNLKNHSRLQARHTWYQWRELLTNTIATDLTEAKQRLQLDEQALGESEASLEQLISQLEEETQKTTEALADARRWLEERDRNLAHKSEIDGLQEVIIRNSDVIDEQQRDVEAAAEDESRANRELTAVSSARGELGQEAERLRPLCKAPERISPVEVRELEEQVALHCRHNNWQPVRVSSEHIEFIFGDRWHVGVKIVPKEDAESQEYTLIAKITPTSDGTDGQHKSKGKRAAASRVYELVESLESAFCVGLTTTGVSRMLDDLSYQFGRLRQLEGELEGLGRLFQMQVEATESQVTGKTASLAYSVNFFSFATRTKFSLRFAFDSPLTYPFGQLDWSLDKAYGDVTEEDVFQLFAETPSGPGYLLTVCDKIHRMYC